MEIYALWAENGALAWFENRGGRFEEEEGFLGADIVELFYMICIVSSNADNFAAVGRDTARCHFDTINIQCLLRRVASELTVMEDLVVFLWKKTCPSPILASIMSTTAFTLHVNVFL